MYSNCMVVYERPVPVYLRAWLLQELVKISGEATECDATGDYNLNCHMAVVVVRGFQFNVFIYRVFNYFVIIFREIRCM